MTTLATQVDEARLTRIARLDHGAHKPPNGEFAACVMEAVAYVAGEPWSDHPVCACPILTTFMVAWNDSLPDADRTRLLLPLVPKLVGTRGSDALANRRATMAADWLIRVHTPAWLRLAGLTEHADRLASFPEITDFAKVPSLMPVLEAARKDSDAAGDAAGATARAAARAAAGDAAWAAAWDAAWDAAGAAARDAARAAAWAAAWDAAGAAAGAAAWDAARDAAGAAAWDAAWAAAWDAAWDAARGAAWAAAWDAAWDAAGAAARDAAGAAARDAAGAKLAPVVAELQTSALALVERMIAVSDSEASR